MAGTDVEPSGTAVDFDKVNLVPAWFRSTFQHKLLHRQDSSASSALRQLLGNLIESNC
jgi:hypothetical protein